MADKLPTALSTLADYLANGWEETSFGVFCPKPDVQEFTVRLRRKPKDAEAQR